ncbi:hypothetical protein CtesDRAFT_PD4824 [Comamonas testosteroni KF-1]|uniref:Uncharacterized protein n=1 Tax=Comamonas testosteroni (strain DSM 14576 / KF-1) TaxID=399795 RepID=B7WZ75_COMTK|nr:hypothetical protein CtesDRAFT_PD4824 [Comamonas testosteroni KF-1]
MALLVAYAQHLGSGHALGIGQLGLHHQHAAQGHGVEHAQRTAGRTDQCRLPEREARPQPQHEQGRQHEDDRGQGAGRRGLGLHQIVFKNVGILEAIEQGHGDHGGGNRRGKGQPDLEPQIDVGGSERQGDERAQQHATEGELSLGWCSHCASGRVCDGTSLASATQNTISSSAACIPAPDWQHR